MRFRVDAILFDIDGTLVDSTAAVTRTGTTWAAEHGIDADEILPAGQQAAAVADLEQLELADLDDVRALPGTQSLLPRLPADRWAAVTSGSRELMRTRLTAAGLPIPEVLVSAEAVEAGKPEPEGYLKAAAPRRTSCLVVEDAPAGIRRPRSGTVLAVATSYPASELRSADAVIPDLTA
jgi:sugar-phosphatase